MPRASLGGSILQSYSTSFPSAPENPISEGGVWRHLGPTTDESLVVTAISGSVHYAHGTMAGGQFTGGTTPVSGTFNDASAYLQNFGPNQSAQAVVWKSPTISGAFQEVEILLRYVDGLPERSTYWGPHTEMGYEINVNIDDGSYLNIGQKDAQNALATVNLSTVIGRAPATGDVLKATIQTVPGGALITVFWNGAQVLQTTDPSPILYGNPGIGFYQNAGESNSEFGFSSFSATEI
jgi:hypothetical protein